MKTPRELESRVQMLYWNPSRCWMCAEEQEKPWKSIHSCFLSPWYFVLKTFLWLAGFACYKKYQNFNRRVKGISRNKHLWSMSVGKTFWCQILPSCCLLNCLPDTVRLNQCPSSYYAVFTETFSMQKLVHTFLTHQAKDWWLGLQPILSIE